MLSLYLIIYLSTMPWRHMAEWRYSSIILYLGTRWRWVVSFTTLPLYPRGNSPRYSFDRRLGGLKSQSGCWREEKNLLPIPGTEPRLLGLSARSLVSITTELSRIPDRFALQMILGIDIRLNVAFHRSLATPILHDAQIELYWFSQ
jgi:hypothetical protein